MTATTAPPLAAVTGDIADTRAARGARFRGGAWVVALSVAVGVSAVVVVGIGPVAINPEIVARAIWIQVFGTDLFGTSIARPAVSDSNIAWLIRLPRVLLGLCVGAALAMSGIVVQSLVRNPLADPYLLGISSGASTGAAASILFGVGLGTGTLALTGSAFVGAAVAILLVFFIARLGGTLIPSRLVFAGIAVSFAFTALTNFLVFASDSRDGSRAVLFWMLGSLGQARWQSIPVAAGGLLLAGALFLRWSRRLDAIAIGDDTARGLGTHPTRFRALAAVTVCLTIASAVAVSGSIGFVGLVVPHLARRLVGSSHRVSLPVAALLGALLLVWADALARTAFAPRELPLGVLTALLGTPLLIVLARRFGLR